MSLEPGKLKWNFSSTKTLTSQIWEKHLVENWRLGRQCQTHVLWCRGTSSPAISGRAGFALWKMAGSMKVKLDFYLLWGSWITPGSAAVRLHARQTLYFMLSLQPETRLLTGLKVVKRRPEQWYSSCGICLDADLSLIPRNTCLHEPCQV